MAVSRSSVSVEKLPNSPMTDGVIRDSVDVPLTYPEGEQEIEVPSSNILAPASSQITLTMPKCSIPPKEEMDPVKSFVSNAFSNQSDPRALQGYRAIMACLRKKDDPPLLRNLMIALRSTAALHQLASSYRRHAHLTHLIFRLNPFYPKEGMSSESETDPKMAPYRDYSLADAHLHLLVSLVSSNSVFLSPAMTAIWKLIQTESSEERSLRLHAALATVTRLVPKATTELAPLFETHFPFRTSLTSSMEWYARQCLFVTSYAPTIVHGCFEVIIDKCLEIDVEIRIEEKGHVALDRDESGGDPLFDLETDSALMREEQPEEKRDMEAQVDEMAEKLDALMLLMFEHVRDSTKGDTSTAQLFYKWISPVFESSMLATHKSKFVQFIIFYVCGLETRICVEACQPPILPHEKFTETCQSERLYRIFCSQLIEIVLDPYRATVTRQSGACYLASFLSRASYVCPETIFECLCALLQWAQAYVDAVGTAPSAPDARGLCELHSLFFAVCQAAFYIVCFRGVEVQENCCEKADLRPSEDAVGVDTQCAVVGLQSLCWTKICGHALRPLRYCLESVRIEFRRQACSFGLLDKDLLRSLESEEDRPPESRPKPTNSTPISTFASLATRRKAHGVGGLGQGKNPLESFFPFDPYLLRRSHHFIDPMYKEWEDTTDLRSTEQRHKNGADQSDAGDNDEEVNPADEEVNSAHLVASLESASLMEGASVSNTPTRVSSNSTLQVEGTRRFDTNIGVLKRSRAPSIETGSW